MVTLLGDASQRLCSKPNGQAASAENRPFLCLGLRPEAKTLGSSTVVITATLVENTIAFTTIA